MHCCVYVYVCVCVSVPRRLRADVEASAAALRDAVERQGSEVAALRAAAAAAEGQSHAAKAELAAVRQEMRRSSELLQHETLSTVLADRGRGPAAALAAAYLPEPMLRLELVPTDSPRGLSSPPAVSPPRQLRQQQQQQQLAPDDELLTELLLESQCPNGRVSQLKGGLGMPRARGEAAAPVLPRWLSGVEPNSNPRCSLLAADSTLVFPAGLAAASGGGKREHASSSACTGLTGSASAVELTGNSWSTPWTAESMQPAPTCPDTSLHQQQHQQQQQGRGLLRATLSAPGDRFGVRSSLLAGGCADPAATTASTGCTAAAHPTEAGGGLASLAGRNAGRLQLLSSMPPPDNPEALDEFLSAFVSSSSPVRGWKQMYCAHTTARVCLLWHWM
jgi:hypothetical protein